MKISIPFLNSISFQEKVLFTKHISVMIHAGIPITEAFQIIQDQTTSPRFAEALISIIKDIKNGQSLSGAIKKYPHIFDQLYISMIGIGEESGTLEKTLEYLSIQLQKDYDLRQQIKTAMLYPGLIVGATTIMGGFISLYILPKLVDFFDAFNTELPLATKLLLFFANTMKSYGFYIFGLIILFIFGFLWFIQLKPIKPYWHAMALRIPMFGSFMASGQLARFARNLSILLQSGIPIAKSLEVTGDSLSNISFKKDLKLIGSSLVRGKSISEALTTHHFRNFPGIVQKMINVGEKTGQLEETLKYLAEFYEDEIDTRSKQLSTIIEPFLLLTIGLVVGFVALAIISPIYELTGSIR